MAKALALLSGGLDSMLAVAVMQEQGVEVVGLVFETPFFSADAARKAARQLKIELQVMDITEEYLQMLPEPQYGHGANMNPCIDCHAVMFRKAGEMLREMGADFLITGEVLGERPMSQSSKGLGLVEKHAGLAGKILRPLSAKLLDMTEMEANGLVDREKMLDINGRSRKPQFALAEKFGITEYPTPAGGCLLTDPGYSRRLKELMQHPEEYRVEDIRLLKIGRHFRMRSGVRVIVGRNKEENQLLKKEALAGDYTMHVRDYPGPVTLLRGNVGEADLQLAASLTVRYSDAKGQEQVIVRALSFAGEEQLFFDSKPLPQEELETLLLGQ